MVSTTSSKKEIDLADVEHIGSLAFGGILLLKGLRHGGLLGTVYKLAGIGLLYRGQKGYKRLYDALGIEMPSTPTGVGYYNVRVDSSVVVNRPREELYRIWRNLENLPTFMQHLVSVVELDDVKSEWTAKGPLGTIVKWEAQIINDVENELIAWQSVEGSGVDNAGSVHFEDAGEGMTRIRTVIRYDPPAEYVGTWVAKAFGMDPQTEVDQDLQTFKSIMEIGGARASGRPTRPGNTLDLSNSNPDVEVL